MKSKRLVHYIVWIILLLNIISISARNSKIDYISIKDGLSHIGVTCFCSDSNGFLWIGTFDGLNRYDGKNFVIYNHQPGEENSLNNNRVSGILEYDVDHLLIGTEAGLCVFDKRVEEFRSFGYSDTPILDNGFINKIKRDDNGFVWVLVNNNTLFQLDNNWQIKKEISVQDYSIQPRIQGFCILGSDEILLLTNTSVYHLTNESSVIRTEGFQRSGIYRDIVRVTDESFYLLSSDGISRVRLIKNNSDFKFKRISYSMQGYDCISALFDSKNNIWIGTKNNGVSCFSYKNNIRKAHFSNKNEMQLSSNWIYCIFEDRVGGIWFGTTEKGINRYNPDRSYFSAYQYNKEDDFSFKNAYITGISQLSNRLVLIGSRKGGVAVYNPKEERFVKPFFQTERIANKTVNVIFEDSRGAIWFSSEGEILRLLPGSSKIEKLDLRKLFQRSDIIAMSFCEDDLGNMWIGARQGLFQLTINSEHVIEASSGLNNRKDNPFKEKIVTTIYNDPLNSDMWVGTWSDGLFHIIYEDPINIELFSFKQYAFTDEQSNSLRSNFISSIHRSTNLQLWIGTEGGGFNRFISGEGGFGHFGVENGLSNNVVKSISEDRQGRLWISTNNGLNLFNPGTGTFKNFNESSGIASNYFNKSNVQLKNGDIVLGGNDGITVFNPNLIGESNYLAEPEFGQFQLSYETIEPGEVVDGDTILKHSLSYTSSIHLDYDQNVFSIEMLGVHFDDANDLRYQYRLSGYDKDWLTVSSANNFASYTNVPYGRYAFEFRVANGFEHWSSESKKIDIVIHPPFWLSPMAYVIYVLLTILILVIVFVVLIKIERLNHKVKFEQFEKEKEKEMHNVKLRFFTNISHEFRTPVSLILGPVESLLNQFVESDGVRHNLLLIKKQGNYLLQLLEQLLEFRKAESEALELKCHKANIAEHIKWIYKGFEKQAGDKNITFRFFAEGPIELWFDAGKIDKIAYNLISNAIKYTPDNGKVEVAISSTDDGMAVLTVSDNGIGLDEEEQKNVFNRFYRAEANSEYSGTGIGLALAQSLAKLHNGLISVQSQKGQGSSFSFYIPISNSYLDKEQMEDGTIESYSSDIREFHDNEETSVRAVFEQATEGKTILVAEDHVEMRQFLEDTLGKSYIVKTCNNGKAAFDKACNLVPDLIISDIMMPGMTGIELLQKLKAEIVTSHIPVILLTAKNEIADKLEGLEYGADDYLGKPFHIDLLMARVKSLLVNRELLHKRYAAGLKAFDETNEIPALKHEVEFINSLNQLIETHIHDADFGSDELSKALYISRTGFYKKMKNLTGKTPGEYLKDFRINKSGLLLKTGEYSVSEVINMVGFKSRSHFYKCFKEIFGQLPADYIKSI